ncbi:unnamed protein product [Moneuplotes crassus]|uniref:Uncharacterized protein n=1 Tax=Euplotes crassus TaxID=5936 RepID=A0AAD2D3M1_EUPCR|nr:unnamed protein product [Moneuplotes crassus]
MASFCVNGDESKVDDIDPKLCCSKNSGIKKGNNSDQEESLNSDREESSKTESKESSRPELEETVKSEEKESSKPEQEESSKINLEESLTIDPAMPSETLEPSSQDTKPDEPSATDPELQQPEPETQLDSSIESPIESSSPRRSPNNEKNSFAYKFRRAPYFEPLQVIVSEIQKFSEYLPKIIFYFKEKSEISDILTEKVNKEFAYDEGHQTSNTEPKLQDKSTNKHKGLVKVCTGPDLVYFEIGRQMSDFGTMKIFTDEEHFFSKPFAKFFHNKYEVTVEETFEIQGVDALVETFEEVTTKPMSLAPHSEDFRKQMSIKIERAISKIQDKKRREEDHLMSCCYFNDTWRPQPYNIMVKKLPFLTPSKLLAMNIFSEAEFNIKEINNKTLIDANYKEFMRHFLKKFYLTFKEVHTYDAKKFIKKLEEIMECQLTEFLNALNKEMDDNKKHAFFLFIRNYLFDKKIISGRLMHLWVTTEMGDSKEKMAQSFNVNICLEDLEAMITDLDKNTSKFVVKGHQLFGEIETYAMTCYYIIKLLLSKNFSGEEPPYRTAREMIKDLHNALKNYYNSNNVTTEEKVIIKKDHKVKYLIVEILRKREVWNYEFGKMCISLPKAHEVLENMQDSTFEIKKDQIISDIKSVISDESN